MRMGLCGTLAVAICVAAAPGQTTRPAAEPEPKAAALLLAGLGGSEPYSRNLLDWINRFHAVLVNKCQLKPDNIVVLTEKADPNANPPRQQSTLEEFRSAMVKMRKTLTPKDQFILFLAGHGQINEPTGKLSLPGKDIDADELADLIGELPTRKVVIINTASGGSEFLKTYTAGGRVILTAGGAGDDGNQTYFAEFFIRGYETGQADLDKNGLIDMLEAYAYAARWTANFYHRQTLISTRRKVGDPLIWLVRGKETRQIWRKLYAGTGDQLGRPNPVRDKDGNLVDPLPKDLDSEPDPEMKFGRFDKHWYNRRVLPEHARLDDDDTKKGFYLWMPYQFEDLPKDEPGEKGHLARRTVLGKTELRQIPAK